MGAELISSSTVTGASGPSIRKNTWNATGRLLRFYNHCFIWLFPLFLPMRSLEAESFKERFLPRRNQKGVFSSFKFVRRGTVLWEIYEKAKWEKALRLPWEEGDADGKLSQEKEPVAGRRG